MGSRKWRGWLLLLFIDLAPIWHCADGGKTQADASQPPGPVYEDVVPQAVPAANPYAYVDEEWSLVVASGARIYGLVRRPDPARYPNARFPAVVLIPGGINPGRMEAKGHDATLLVESGMVVVCYNDEGRVSSMPGDIRSEGSEDYNGPRSQDNLARVIAMVASMRYVSPNNLGLGSFSFGVSTSSGCLSRHPELPVRYYVDGEGPSSSYVTCHEPRALDADPSNDKHESTYAVLGRYSAERDPSAENVAFWKERDAVNHIGAFRGRYLRLQAHWDHNQPPLTEEGFDDFELPPLWWHNKHTTDMANAAVAGGVPWVRVNHESFGNRVNATYGFDRRPIFIPGAIKSSPTPWYAQGINAMARLQATDPLLK